MKIANGRMSVSAGMVLLLFGTVAVGQDWPQWRGPNRDGKAADFKVPTTWPKELAQKWKVKVGNGVATPALVGDKIYVFTREGEDEILRCLEAGDGKEVWQYKYKAAPATRAAASFPGPRSSPTVADGKVITLGVQGKLACLDAATGKELWTKDDYHTSLPRFFTSSSPIVVDGLCIAQLGGEDKGAILAYDLASGAEKWKWAGDGTAYASPVLFNLVGVKMIVAETAKSIAGVAVADGKLLWKVPFSVRYNACTPMVHGQTIIYSGSGQGTRAIRIEKEGDRFTAKELWHNSENGVQFDTPIVKDGMVFGLSDGDKFFCLNAESGKTAWSVPKSPTGAGAPPPAAGKGGGQPGGKGQGGRGRGGMMGGGRGYGSIVDAGSELLALTPSSELVVFEPTDKQYTELARIKVAATPTYAYPVLSGNRIFIKDADSVTLYTLK